MIALVLTMAAGAQTLNVVGNVKHGIKTGEYFTIKNATINVTSAVGDGSGLERHQGRWRHED